VDEDVIEANLQSRFRSVVGIILYFIKNSRPVIATMVKELAKCMDDATLAAYKKMLIVIRFVLDTHLFCLKTEEKKE
jgi:hypothetical protein